MKKKKVFLYRITNKQVATFVISQAGKCLDKTEETNPVVSGFENAPLAPISVAICSISAFSVKEIV